VTRKVLIYCNIP